MRSIAAHSTIPLVRSGSRMSGRAVFRRMSLEPLGDGRQLLIYTPAAATPS